MIYQHSSGSPGGVEISDTAGLLGDMQLWSFGLPFAETLPDGEVLVVYYAGTPGAMDIHWARLKP